MSKSGDPTRSSPRDQIAAAYDRCAASLFRYAAVLLADRSLAEDALQQAFAKLTAMGKRIGELASVDHYLRIVVRNECYRLLTAKKPAAEVSENDAVLLEPVDAGITGEEQRQKIESVLRRLPPEQREIIHLKVYESLTFQEISELLNISLYTAASRYRYAAEKLRESLSALVEN